LEAGEQVVVERHGVPRSLAARADVGARVELVWGSRGRDPQRSRRAIDPRAEAVEVVLVEVADQVTVRRAASEEFPGRRNAIDIGFLCESGCKPTLRIIQHKGHTFLEWLRVGNGTAAEIES
jgi:hypothetical protein